MSDDPQTRRQIESIAADNRPLLVLDVDEVVLEFLGPFMSWLKSENYSFRPISFALDGNIFDADGAEASKTTVKELVTRFFEVQHDWQTLAPGFPDALEPLADQVQIVLLTAMPHRHFEAREALLSSLSVSYPLVTTEKAKGPAVALLHGGRDAPVAFIDDMAYNLLSVGKAMPGAALIHLMAHRPMKALMPPLPDSVIAAEDWYMAAAEARQALGV
ncbi:hypothetical protein [Notoacmeibacter sp. MSK16QG-6]|uniref:hypothetical protein n=1 Tax=Notoacmeibacter sp. MSK16QG-6 TaxID=2957982 RepID=UPI00209CAF20|nr:hypothetical protein [Notoacmeibacter sp. MSK16QG-6]MCP1197897.1 hypothetical protein [Notoacmeibacter sp. MSK16QG-6]